MKQFWLTSVLSAAFVICTAATAAHAADQLPGAQEAPEAKANTFYLTASIASHHFEERKKKGHDYNEFNPGLGLELVRQPFAHAAGIDFRMSYIAGFYHNSIYRMSAYAGGGPEACYGLQDKFSVCAGVSAGVVTGYEAAVGPALLGLLKIEHNPSGTFAKVDMLPSHHDFEPAAVSLQIGMKLPW